MPKKILLADDSITIQKVVELTFSDGDYEVTAVNNGAKAVARLAEMRPDIILSDIIMPEKNGYEVCEYVKSHPDFRNIPVVLLTGTFEPFDPDRAEKAGCDAVVTKPFESQSLIHKVEELIAQAQSAASAASAIPAAPEPSPWMDDTAALSDPAPSPFSTATGGFPSTPPAIESFTHDADIFGAAPTPQATTEMPFELPSDSPFGGGETRAFPRMSFEDLSAAASTPAAEPPPAAPEPSPWDAPADTVGETRAFQKMSFDDFATPAPAAEPEPVPFSAPEPEADSPFGAAPAESPFGAPPFGAPPSVDDFSGETRAFPRMSFEEMQQFAAPQPAPEIPAVEPEPQVSATPEPSPWEEEAPAFGGETRAFPKLSFDDFQQMASTPPANEAPIEPSPWGDPAPETSSPFASADDAPAFGGETRAFPKLSFDDFQSASAPAAASEPEIVPEPEPVESLWSPTAETSAIDAPSTESFSTAAAPDFAAPDFSTPDYGTPDYGTPDFAAPAIEPEATGAEAMPEDLPFATETTPEPEPAAMAAEPSWSPLSVPPPAFEEAPQSTSPVAEAAAEPDEPVVPPPALAPESPAMPIAARSSELSDDQIDRIARRVVELMSDSVVRNIAWEVIPDLAEMVVKERIRQLEAEA